MAASPWPAVLLVPLIVQVFRFAEATSSHRSHTVEVNPEGHQRSSRKGLLRRDVIVQPPQHTEMMRREVASDASLLQSAPPKQSMSAESSLSGAQKLTDNIHSIANDDQKLATKDEGKDTSSLVKEEEKHHSTKVRDPNSKAGDLQLFNSFDDNHDDRLQAKEIMTLLSRIGVSTDSFDWTDYDLDQNGYLTESEFVAAGPAVFKAAQQDAVHIPPKPPKVEVNSSLSEVDDVEDTTEEGSDPGDDSDEPSNFVSKDPTGLLNEEDSIGNSNSTSSQQSALEDSEEEDSETAEDDTTSKTDSPKDSTSTDSESEDGAMDSPEAAASFVEIDDQDEDELLDQLRENWGAPDSEVDIKTMRGRYEGLREALGDEFARTGHAFSKGGLEKLASLMQIGQMAGMTGEVPDEVKRHLGKLHEVLKDGVSWEDFAKHMKDVAPEYGNGLIGPEHPDDALARIMRRNETKAQTMAMLQESASNWHDRPFQGHDLQESRMIR